MTEAAALSIYTIGHSTRTIEVFVDILRAVGVTQIVDIRSHPRSRTNPQYNLDTLPRTLEQYQIGHVYLKDLGGRRPRQLSVDPATNGFWKNQSFHNYADYATTKPFQVALAELLERGGQKSSAIMCSEAVWWRCHRRIVADYLLNKGCAVYHLMGAGRVTLDTVPAYVAFLTGMLEGSEGRMRIIEQDPPVADTRAWDVRLALAYGGARIDCKARIDQSGKLSFSEQSVSQMTEQSSAGEFKGPLGHRFADRADALAPLFDADWTSLDAVRRDLLVRQCMSAAFPVSDLSGLECAALNDQDGALWGEDARLLLEGISVRRFVEMRGRALGNSTSRRLSGMRDSQSGATARVAWLGRQVQSRIQDWSPQPYEAFARVYRLHGFADEANIVLAEKARRDIKKERSRMWPGLRQLFGPIYEAALVTFWGGLFRYGLSPTRALATCAAFLLVGWIGVEAANHGQPLPMLGLDFSGSGPPALELSLTPVQGVAVAGENSLGIEVVPGSAVRTSIPCGQAIDTWIYATDVFIPLLDLREEGICSIRSDAWARPWRIAKAVYAALGWLVLSLTVITLSAPLRRNTGE